MKNDSGYLTKGARVSYTRINTQLVSLSGMQMKAGAHVESGVGVVTHIYGLAATPEEAQRREFSFMEVHVRPDGKDKDIVLTPAQVTAILPEGS